MTPVEFGELLELTLNTTYFQYKGQIYQQTYKAAIRSPLLPVIINIFMEKFELKALQAATHLPKFFGRYVDDIGTFQENTR